MDVGGISGQCIAHSIALYAVLVGASAGVVRAAVMGGLGIFWYGGFDLVKHAILRLLLNLDAWRVLPAEMFDGKIFV